MKLARENNLKYIILFSNFNKARRIGKANKGRRIGKASNPLLRRAFRICGQLFKGIIFWFILRNLLKSISKEY